MPAAARPERTDTEAASENEPVTLTVATSQNEETPNYYCGVELLKERLEEADIGFTVELYPASQLGPDADRFPLVQAGDIDIDLQGASALSATYEPIGVVDAAYAFDDVDHAFKWIDEGSEDLLRRLPRGDRCQHRRRLVLRQPHLHDQGRRGAQPRRPRRACRSGSRTRRCSSPTPRRSA